MVNQVPALRPALADRQNCVPVRLCGRCGGEMYPGECLFCWEEREVCADCFRSAVAVWMEEAAPETARELGVETRTL